MTYLEAERRLAACEWKLYRKGQDSHQRMYRFWAVGPDYTRRFGNALADLERWVNEAEREKEWRDDHPEK
jgi:hypothetical protein